MNVRKISPKITVKTILITKPIILSSKILKTKRGKPLQVLVVKFSNFVSGLKHLIHSKHLNFN